jgi:hypothetical protein
LLPPPARTVPRPSVHASIASRARTRSTPVSQIPLTAVIPLHPTRIECRLFSRVSARTRLAASPRTGSAPLPHSRCAPQGTTFSCGVTPCAFPLNIECGLQVPVPARRSRSLAAPEQSHQGRLLFTTPRLPPTADAQGSARYALTRRLLGAAPASRRASAPLRAAPPRSYAPGLLRPAAPLRSAAGSRIVLGIADSPARCAPVPPLSGVPPPASPPLRSRASCSPPQAAPKTPHRCSAIPDAPFHSELSVNVPASGFADSPLRGAVHGYTPPGGGANSLSHSAGCAPPGRCCYAATACRHSAACSAGPPDRSGRTTAALKLAAADRPTLPESLSQGSLNFCL